MLVKYTLSLAAVASVASAGGRCANDNCQKAVKNAGNYGWWDCYFGRRVTTTPKPYTWWSTHWNTHHTTHTVVVPYETDVTTTISYTDTYWDTATENPTTTISTTSTMPCYAGTTQTVKKRVAKPVPTANVVDVAARAPIGHFPLSVAIAAETGSPSKRAAAANAHPIGHFPASVLPDPEDASVGINKRTSPQIVRSCPSWDKYMSACACNGVPQATVTAVRPTYRMDTYRTTTMTGTTTSTSTYTVTQTSNVTTTVSSTTTTTITSTDTYSTSVLATPTCSSYTDGPAAQYQYRYNLEYFGFKTLNDNSPANNQGAPAISQVLSGSMNTCDASNDCIGWASSQFSPLGGGGYFTCNLRFRPDTSDWLCVAYYDQTPASYYDQDSPGVEQSYGWTKRP